MKHKILRILINAVLVSLISGIAVSLLGLMLRWNTYTQFSDGFFWAGTIFILIGFINVMGIRTQGIGVEYYAQSVVHVGKEERFKIWEADLLRGYSLLAFLGTSGMLMFVLSGLTILVGRRF